MITGYGWSYVVFAVIAAAALGAFFGMALDRRARSRADAYRSKLAQSRAEAESRRQKPEWIKGTQAQPGTAGFTIAAALNGVGCLGRSAAEEPVFVLVARDRCASMIVRDWANMAEKLGSRPEKVWGARAMADRMEEWRDHHGGGKVPD
jgi:hypothetical protein